MRVRRAAVGMGGQRAACATKSGHFPEFRKKIVQATAADMQPPIPADFFDRFSVEELSQFTPRELENLGRLAYPVVRRADATHYQRISWDEAFDRIADQLRRTDPGGVFLFFGSQQQRSRISFAVARAASTVRTMSTIARTTATRRVVSVWR